MRRHRRLALWIFLLLLVGVTPSVWAHVGSPDVFYEGDAGPYKLFVTIRPPEVIPGVADIVVRSAAVDISGLRIVPLPLVGAGARFAPTPDLAVRSQADPQQFTGHLWMMTAGAWQIRILVEGARGAATLSVPVPALPQRTPGMQGMLGLLLAAFLLILVTGLVSIVGAWAGQARLPPGQDLTPLVRRRARIAMAVTSILMGLVVAGMGLWWRAEARKYDAHVYKPLGMTAQNDHGHLRLTLSEPGWENRKLDDLLPDHDHLMHLFVLRMPSMEQMFHLHPSREGAAVFGTDLPPLAAGTYRLYADIVHATGLPETLVADLDLPAPVAGTPLSGDDAEGHGPALSAAQVGSTVSPLPRAGVAAPEQGGPQMVWLRQATPYRARSPAWLRFRVEDQPGHAATDLELYMGMLGHAAIVKTDGSVFAHLHPSGSVPMATLALTAPAAGTHHNHHQADSLPSEVAFPFAFPQPGEYRIFIQIKRLAKVATGFFDVHVDPSP